MLLADLESQMHSEWVVYISPRKVGSQQTLSFLSQLHRPAEKPAIGMGAAHSSASHRAIKLNRSYFSSGHKENNPPAQPWEHTSVQGNKGRAPQPNPTGRKMKATMGQCPQRGCMGQPSNNTKQKPRVDKPPKRIQQQVPRTQKAANIPSPLFATLGVLIATFHKSEGKCEVILFQ